MLLFYVEKSSLTQANFLENALHIYLFFILLIILTITKT